MGRAVTGVYVPMRPDLNDCLLKYGHEEEGRRGYFNQWVIVSLVEDDVVVVDMFDKIFQGTYVGGNLSTAIKTRTKRGGAVIWGGIRDMEQIVKIAGINVYYRGIDPTDPKAEEYRHLTWEEELAEAEKYEKDANASDVRL